MSPTTRSAWVARCRSCSCAAPGEVGHGAGCPAASSGGGRRSRRVSPARNRIEVMHGVNLDMLGRRDPALYGTLTLAELEAQIASEPTRSISAARSSRPTTKARSSSTCTRCRRGRRDPAEPRRVDALRVGDPRRARDRRAPCARDPPVGYREARAAGDASRSSATCASRRLRPRPRGLPRRARAAPRGARRGRA